MSFADKYKYIHYQKIPKDNVMRKRLAINTNINFKVLPYLLAMIMLIIFTISGAQASGMYHKSENNIKFHQKAYKMAGYIIVDGISERKYKFKNGIKGLLFEFNKTCKKDEVINILHWILSSNL